MKLGKTLIGATIMLGMLGPTAPTVTAGEQEAAERGRALFQNSRAFGGRMACNACHPNGSGLERAAGKTSFKIMGQTQRSLEEAINFCIVNANKGQAIATDSTEMKDMVAYLKSLAAVKPKTPGYGAPPPAPAPGYGAPRTAPGYGVRPPAPGPGYGRPR